MKVLNGKKGLILAILMMAVLIGAYAVQYYTWTVGYEIIQLTSFEVSFEIPPASGATKGWEVAGCWEPAITVDGKALKIHFMVDDETLDELEGDFHELSLITAVYGEVDDYVAIGEMDLVVDGERNPEEGDNDVFLFEINSDVLWDPDGILDELDYMCGDFEGMFDMAAGFADDLLGIASELRFNAEIFEGLEEFELAEYLRGLAEKVDHVLEKVKELLKDLIDIHEETEDMLDFCFVYEFFFIKASDLEDWVEKLEAMAARIVALGIELDEAAVEFEVVATAIPEKAEELEGVASYFESVAGHTHDLCVPILLGEAEDMRYKILDYWRIPQLTPAVLLPGEDYDVCVIAQYWTGAVEGLVEEEFIINVYAIEVWE